MKYKLIIIILLITGCSSGNVIDKPLIYKVESEGITREVKRLRDKSFVRQVEGLGSRKLLSVDLKKKIKVVGKMSVKNFVTILGYNVGKVCVFSGAEEETSEIEIDGEYTIQEVRNIFNAYVDFAGYKMVEDGDVLLVSRKDEKVLLTSVLLLGLGNIRVDKVKELGYEGVKILRIGRGVALIGDYQAVRKLKSIIEIIDVPGSGEVILDFVRVSNESIEKFYDLMKDFGDKYGGVKVVSIVDDLVMIAGQDKVEIANVKSMLTLISTNARKDYFVISVESRSVDKVESMLKDSVKDVSYVVDVENSKIVVLSGYADFLKVRDFVQLIDKDDRQILVRLYIIDVQKSLTDNFGLDAQYNVGDLQITSKLRESVGMGVVGQLGDLKLFVNMLRHKFKGRVVSSPMLNMKNNTNSSVNFGQQIPTLKGKQSATSGEIVQSVEYITVGLGVTIGAKICGDKILINMSINNSSVLENAGVEGNPQFSSDNIKVEFLVKNGMASVISGLNRNNKEDNRKGVIPFLFGSIFKKSDSREFVVCVHAEVVKVEQNNFELIKNILN